MERASAGPPAGSFSPHVLTITPFYPSAENESNGCFVAEPLAELIQLGVRSTVLAVAPFYRTPFYGIRPSGSSSAPPAGWCRYPSLPSGLGLASAGKGLFLRLRGPVAKLHAQSPIDLIHAHAALPCGNAAALLHHHLNIPYVVTVHGLDAFSSVQVGGWPGAWCEKVSRQVFRDARRVIGVSRHVCDEVQKGAGANCAVTVVHNGVDPARFTPGADYVPPVVLTVGNLIPTKGHELVVRALATLRTEFSSLTWELIGEGPEQGRLRQLAEKLGVLDSIRFLGRRSRNEVADACRRCVLFVLPSRYEGLGCVYLEAMASGKVAVGCRGQGIEEVIRHGENGWLVAPDSLQELIDGLRVLLRDEPRRRQIGRAARQTIMHSLTLQHQAQRLAAIYRECIG